MNKDDFTRRWLPMCPVRLQGWCGFWGRRSSACNRRMQDFLGVDEALDHSAEETAVAMALELETSVWTHLCPIIS